MKYDLGFSAGAWDEYENIKKLDKKTALKIKTLLMNARENPTQGLGKPEKLKGRINTYSRKINKKDRLVYQIKESIIYVIQCKGHYDDK